MKPRTLRGLSCLLVLAGLAAAGCGLWIPTKAALAQLLLERSWEQAVRSGEDVPPWPWADTWPVARLQVATQQVDLIVLAGASGATLAFGPGHLFGSSAPGEPGNTVLAGHRDTHFAFLRTVRHRETLTLETREGERLRYQVMERRVVHERETALLSSEGWDQLTLVTCWPFDAVRPGGPLRFVVSAERVPVGLGDETRTEPAGEALSRVGPATRTATR